MTQRVDVRSDDGLILLNQLVTNTAMRRRVWEKAAAGKRVTITPSKPKPPPPPPVSTGSVFAGKGLFTTANAKSAFGKGATWIAYQMDPEGTPNTAFDPASIGMYWMARPTQEMADKANRNDVPFIAQAESQPELDLALSLNVRVPKALVGNPSSWSKAGFDKAAAQGWELILEWYANAQPSYVSPDARSYPRFVNVCFGIYDASSEQPGQGRRVPLADYRAVWKGSFSCWAADYMTDADWAVFGAA